MSSRQINYLMDENTELRQEIISLKSQLFDLLDKISLNDRGEVEIYMTRKEYDELTTNDE